MSKQFIMTTVFVGLSGLIALAAHAEGIDTLLVIEPSRQYPRNSEGDVVTLKDGRLCLVYTRFTGCGRDDSAADIVARTSSDEGKTWSNDRILVRNEGRENVMSVSIISR